MFLCVFFFNDTATTEIYTLSLHDALPIYSFFEPTWYQTLTATSGSSGSGLRTTRSPLSRRCSSIRRAAGPRQGEFHRERTQLKSRHLCISLGLFYLSKKIRPPQTAAQVSA